jgi:hypothetical protein
MNAGCAVEWFSGAAKIAADQPKRRASVNRATVTVLGLLIVCLLLPTLASYATQAVPLLVALLVLCGALRLASSPGRR